MPFLVWASSNTSSISKIENSKDENKNSIFSIVKIDFFVIFSDFVTQKENIMKKSLLTLLWIFVSVIAEADETRMTTSLLPRYASSFDIVPFLPENYIFESSVDDPEFYEGFWAPKDTLKMMTEGKMPAYSFIQLMTVTDIHSQKDMDEYIAQVKQQFPRKFSIKKYQWGTHEVTAVSQYIGQDIIYMAFVGLNDPDKTFLMLRLVYPEKVEFGNGNEPSKKDLEFWNRFLTKTR